MIKKEVSNLQRIMKKKAAIGLQEELIYKIMVYILFQDHSIEDMIDITRRIAKELNMPTLKKDDSLIQKTLSYLKNDFPFLETDKPLGEEFKMHVVEKYMLAHPEVMFGEKQYTEFIDSINTLIKK